MNAEPRPLPLRAVCLLVLVEAVAFAVLGAAFLVELVRGRSVLAGASLFLVAFALGVAAVLAAAARGLWRGRRWARSPVMTWQIMLVVLALGWFGVEPTWWSAVVVAVAVLVGAGLLLPTVVAATLGTNGADGADGAEGADAARDQGGVDGGAGTVGADPTAGAPDQGQKARRSQPGR